MVDQAPKQRVDTGIIGNASSGDILYDGGVKLNSNMDAIYNAFGDQRMFVDGVATGNQTIHATGYFQKASAIDFRTPVPLGSQWDVNATDSGITVVIQRGKVGECVSFINSNGSISVNNPLNIRLTSGSSFVGVSATEGLVITTPNTRVDCWCTAIVNNNPVWNYSIRSMFGRTETPIEGTFPVVGSSTIVPIAGASEFNTIKLLLTASTADGKIMKTSEVLLLIDNIAKNIYSTEYAVLKVGTLAEDLYTIRFDIDANNKIVAAFTTTQSTVRLAIKSIATQRIGSA